MIPNFKFWCQKVLPSVYDDSLSYYELLCKVVDYLNKTIDQSNATAKEMEELKSYVDNYFKNLDVTTEINNKLDVMAADGTLDKIINENIFNELNQDIKNIDAKVDTSVDNIYKKMSNTEWGGLDFKPVGVVATDNNIISAAKAGNYIIGFDADNWLLISNVDYNTILTKVPINKSIIPHVNDASEYDNSSILCACALTGKVARVTAPNLVVTTIDIPACSDMFIGQISKAKNGYFVSTGIGPNDMEIAFISEDFKTLYSRKKYTDFANTIVYPGGGVYAATQGSFARGNMFYSLVSNSSGGHWLWNGYSTLAFNKNSELCGSSPTHYSARGEVEGCYDDGQCIHIYTQTEVGKGVLIKASPSCESVDRYYVDIDANATTNTYGTSKYLRTAFVAANIFTGNIEATLNSDIDEDAGYYSFLRASVTIVGNSHSLNVRGDTGNNLNAKFLIKGATVVHFFEEQYMQGCYMLLVNCTIKNTATPAIRVQDGFCCYVQCTIETGTSNSTSLHYGGVCTARNCTLSGTGNLKIGVIECVHNTSNMFEGS